MPFLEFVKKLGLRGDSTGEFEKAHKALEDLLNQSPYLLRFIQLREHVQKSGAADCGAAVISLHPIVLSRKFPVSLILPVLKNNPDHPTKGDLQLIFQINGPVLNSLVGSPEELEELVRLVRDVPAAAAAAAVGSA